LSEFHPCLYATLFGAAQPSETQSHK
jgi:hypothetical protein